jgi:hypothetical protein
VAIALAMYFGLFENQTFYKSLAITEQARGLITFLFVLSTSAVILLVAIAIFWVEQENDLKDRFAYAKDLLTIVIGIIGTIMGFYFGLQKPDTPAGRTPVVQHGEQTSPQPNQPSPQPSQSSSTTPTEQR